MAEGPERGSTQKTDGHSMNGLLLRLQNLTGLQDDTASAKKIKIDFIDFAP